MIELEAKFLIQKEDFILKEPITRDTIKHHLSFFQKKITPRLFNWEELTITDIILQNDIYYNSKMYNMKENDKVLRNRIEIFYDINDYSIMQEKSLLTYKGPNQSTSYKSREEIEIKANPEIWEVFEGLTFSPSRSVKKLRFVFKHDTNSEITIVMDSVEHLGYYFEAELIINTDEKEIAEQKLTDFIDKNKFKRFHLENKSYLTLLENTLTE